MRITATVIAKDEAERLPACLASLTWADEILVLDSGSTDGTPDLARAAGARVVVEPWRGFGAMKNRAAELAGHDWICNIDADERPDAALIHAICSADGSPAAYRVRRRNRVAGRAIRHFPWAWDGQVRLYDRRRAAFRVAKVHESVHAPGPVPWLDGVLDHLTYRDWADCAARHARYAALWAEDARARGRRPRPWDPLRAPVALLQHLLVRGHLLGGIDGWRWSAAHAAYVAGKYRLLRGA